MAVPRGRSRLATPHQSPFRVPASPQGEAFFISRRSANPLVLPQQNGVPPRAHASNRAAGRWRSHRVRETGKKKDRSSRGEFIRTFESSAFFRIACRNFYVNKTQVFGRARKGLLPSKAASRSSPITSSHRSPYTDAVPQARSQSRRRSGSFPGSQPRCGQPPRRSR